MLTAIIDYESGNLHSAQKAFQKMASETDGGDVVVTDKADIVAKADRIVLPGDGAFPACAAALRASGCFDALVEAVEIKARPFIGICVGMQLMAQKGYEYDETDGLGWINGAVRKDRTGRSGAESAPYGVERSGDRHAPPCSGWHQFR